MCPAAVHRPAGDDGIVLRQHPVVEDRDAGGIPHRAVGREVRPGKDDVVRLPLAGGPARVDERGRLPVHCRGPPGGGGIVGGGVGRRPAVVPVLPTFFAPPPARIARGPPAGTRASSPARRSCRPSSAASPPRPRRRTSAPAARIPGTLSRSAGPRLRSRTPPA